MIIQETKKSLLLLKKCTKLSKDPSRGAETSAPIAKHTRNDWLWQTSGQGLAKVEDSPGRSVESSSQALRRSAGQWVESSWTSYGTREEAIRQCRSYYYKYRWEYPQRERVLWYDEDDPRPSLLIPTTFVSITVPRAAHSRLHMLLQMETHRDPRILRSLTKTFKSIQTIYNIIITCLVCLIQMMDFPQTRGWMQYSFPAKRCQPRDSLLAKKRRVTTHFLARCRPSLSQEQPAKRMRLLQTKKRKDSTATISCSLLTHELWRRCLKANDDCTQAVDITGFWLQLDTSTYTSYAHTLLLSPAKESHRGKLAVVHALSSLLPPLLSLNRQEDTIRPSNSSSSFGVF